MKIKTFPKGVIARDNRKDAAFPLQQEVPAKLVREGVYRIIPMIWSPWTYDTHFIYDRDNQKDIK